MIIDELRQVINGAKEMWENAAPADLSVSAHFDSYAGVKGACARGLLIRADNLCCLKAFIDGKMGAPKMKTPGLIYMDPPFFSKAKYRSSVAVEDPDGGSIKLELDNFSDRWTDKSVSRSPFAIYLTELTARMMAARELLADDGCLWIHLDHHAAHYVKVIADEVFGGANHMMNEVIWHYKSGGANKKSFARKHDTLLFYVKNPGKYFFEAIQEKSYNRGRKPYRFKGVKEYRDGDGWYTLVNMRDVWRIDMVGRTSSERTGYATQKPELLMERIIRSCSAEGGLCMDIYGGSGSLAAASARLGRSWISVDNSRLASLYSEKRMSQLGAPFLLVDQEAGMGMTAAVKLSLHDALSASKKLLRVEVCGYDVRPEALPLGEADKVKVMDIACERPSALIAGIAIERLKDGGVPSGAEGHAIRPEFVTYDGGDADFLIDAQAGTGDFDVRLIDIFGNVHICRAETT